MKKYVVIHALKTTAPSNMNRDELGRPKTALYGGKERLRVSSQSFKRALRKSDIFREAFGVKRLGHLSRNLGPSTYEQYVGEYEERKLVSAIVYCNIVLEHGSDIISYKNLNKNGEILKRKSIDDAVKKFFDVKKKDGESAALATLRTGSVLRLHDHQVRGYEEAAAFLLENGFPQTREEVDHIEHLIHVQNAEDHAVDIALFGSMYASASQYEIDGAAMVAHAISVDEVSVESDYFTAVDDFSSSGSGHLDNKDFASGTLYYWVAVDTERLVANVGSKEAASKAIQCLIKAIAIENPSGSQKSFASQTVSDYVRVEITDNHPVSYHTAFETPITSNAKGSVMGNAISALESVAASYDTVYGDALSSEVHSLNRLSSSGSLSNIFSAIEEIFA